MQEVASTVMCSSLYPVNPFSCPHFRYLAEQFNLVHSIGKDKHRLLSPNQ